MTTQPTTYPLCWPDGWKRTPQHQRKAGAFQKHGSPVTTQAGADRLHTELDRMRATDVVISTNVLVSLTGLPRGNTAPLDPGVAAYFTVGRRSMVLACDAWQTVGANLTAIAKHIDAMRGMDRWGVGGLERALEAYAMLAAPPTWRQLLEDPRSLAEAERTYRDLMRRAHPDMGGSTSAAAALTEAISTARKELR